MLWKIKMHNNDHGIHECTCCEARDQFHNKEWSAHPGLGSCQICKWGLHCRGLGKDWQLNSELNEYILANLFWFLPIFTLKSRVIKQIMKTALMYVSIDCCRWDDNASILTHCGRVTHICVGNATIIGSDNGLSPDRRQATTWTNAEILLIGPLRTNFSDISIKIRRFSFTKMHLKTSSVKQRPFFSASVC